MLSSCFWRGGGFLFFYSFHVQNGFFMIYLFIRNLSFIRLCVCVCVHVVQQHVWDRVCMSICISKCGSWLHVITRWYIISFNSHLWREVLNLEMVYVKFKYFPSVTVKPLSRPNILLIIEGKITDSSKDSNDLALSWVQSLSACQQLL